MGPRARERVAGLPGVRETPGLGAPPCPPLCPLQADRQYDVPPHHRAHKQPKDSFLVEQVFSPHPLPLQTGTFVQDTTCITILGSPKLGRFPLSAAVCLSAKWGDHISLTGCHAGTSSVLFAPLSPGPSTEQQREGTQCLGIKE